MVLKGDSQVRFSRSFVFIAQDASILKITSGNKVLQGNSNENNLHLAHLETLRAMTEPLLRKRQEEKEGKTNGRTGHL